MNHFMFPLTILFVLLLVMPGYAQTSGAEKEHKGNDSAQNVRITKGPVIEGVGPHTAVIAWSTNVNSSTVLRYGTNSGHLTERAEAAYGGDTHRVHLSDLQPNTTYYFQAESGQGSGTGTAAQSKEESFHTPAKGGQEEHYPKPGPGI